MALILRDFDKPVSARALVKKTVRTKSEDGKEKVVSTFLASTDVEDRYEDIVAQNSWLLKNYRANPVILTDHRWTAGAVVGRATRLEVVDVDGRAGGKGLEIDIEWDIDDEDAAKVAGKVERGFLNAVSVGFRSGKWTLRNKLPKEHPYYADSYGYVLEDNELLEVSVVAIPANQEALAQRSAQELDVRKTVEAVLSQPGFLERLLEAQQLAKPEPSKQKSTLPWVKS